MNLAQELKKALNDDFWSIITLIGRSADLYGVNAYIVGGVVRDLLLSKPIFDIDIVIEGDAIDFCSFMQEQGMGIISRQAEDFGTAKFRFNEFLNYEIDFASTRTEKYPKAGHLPVVDQIGCSLKEDILRRDFRVNALAIKINEKSFGELLDYTGGLADIETKELKILHDESFVDDPTRIIRGLRFIHKLGFFLEEKTRLLQQKYLNDFDNEDICYERIKQVVKLAFNLNSAELVVDFIKNDVYKLLCSKPRVFDVLKLNNVILDNLAIILQDSIWLIYLASLISSQEAEKLNLTNKEMQIIKSLESLLAQNVDINSNFEIYNLFNNEPLEAVVAYSAFDENNIVQKYLSALKDIKPILNGNDLLNLGVAKGKLIGEVLNKILEEKLNGRLNSCEEEVNFVKKFI